MIRSAALAVLLLAAHAPAAVVTGRIPRVEFALRVYDAVGELAANRSMPGHDASLPPSLALPGQTPAAEAARIGALSLVMDPRASDKIGDAVRESATRSGLDAYRALGFPISARAQALQSALRASGDEKTVLAQAEEALRGGDFGRLMDGAAWNDEAPRIENAAPLREEPARLRWNRRGYAVLPFRSHVDERRLLDVAREVGRGQGMMGLTHPDFAANAELAPVRRAKEALDALARRWLPRSSLVSSEIRVEGEKDASEGAVQFHEDGEANVGMTHRILAPLTSGSEHGTLVADRGRILRVPPRSVLVLNGAGIESRVPGARPVLHAAPSSWAGTRLLLVLGFNLRSLL